MSKEIQYLNIGSSGNQSLYTLPVGKVAELILTGITIPSASGSITIGGNLIRGTVSIEDFAANGTSSLPLNNSFRNNNGTPYRRSYFLGPGQNILFNTQGQTTTLNAILIIEDIGVQ
jgi:hypothetical protein